VILKGTQVNRTRVQYVFRSEGEIVSISYVSACNSFKFTTFNINFYQDVRVWNASFYPSAGLEKIWPFTLLGDRNSMVINVFYFYICTFSSLCAVPYMAVVCSSSVSCFPGMLRRSILHDFDMVPVAPINTCLLLLLLFIITVSENSYHISKILYS